MNTNAIYKIKEDGSESYFYSKHAGGFSYPFEVASYLKGLKNALQQPRIRQQDVLVTPLLLQMKGTDEFPEEVVGKDLFKSIPDEMAESESWKIDTPFFITIDVNEYTVGFHFNQQFEELEDMDDITLPVYNPCQKYSRGGIQNGSLAWQMTEEIKKPFHEANEIYFRKEIEKAMAEQQTQGQQMIQ